MFRLTAVWWPGTQSARDSHVIACNFAKYSPIYFFSVTDLAIKLSLFAENVSFLFLAVASTWCSENACFC